MSGPPFRLPSLSALSAFESAARHCNFSRAADELRTSQPAVSRHVSGLEASLGTRLFDRSRNRVMLTSDGRRLYHAVVTGLDEIARAVDELRRLPRRRMLTIACSHDIAHLWLMPRHDALQALVGAQTEIRVMVSEYEQQAMIPDDNVDIALTYRNPLPGGSDAVRLFDEEVFQVCAPGRAEAADDLPLLHLNKRNFGWAEWSDWFAARDLAVPVHAHDRRYSSYVYLLEAAADGAGMALAWAGLVERYLEQSRLVRCGDDRLRTGGAFHAVVNRHGPSADLTNDVVEFLSTP
jgi:LysR family glycine cleavage system transcriptional activator